MDWKVGEFNVEIFKALKTSKLIIGIEKSGINIENSNADLEKTSIKLLITHTSVNFLAVYDTKHLMFRVQKCPIRYLE